MALTLFVPTDAQRVWGKGGVDSTFQTRRGGSLQVQHGLPARGRESLCSPQPNPHYLPCTAHSRAERRRCPLAHLYASRWAHPQSRRGRHPPATRPAPHVREGWYQADGLHHRRPHRQADHHGLSEWWRRRSWDVAAIRGKMNCVLGKWDSKELTKQRHVPCQIWPFTLPVPRLPFQTCFFSAGCQREPFPCIFRLHLHVSRVVVWSVGPLLSLALLLSLCCSYLFSLTFLHRCIDSCAFLKHFSPILTNKTSAQ